MLYKETRTMSTRENMQPNLHVGTRPESDDYLSDLVERLDEAQPHLNDKQDTSWIAVFTNYCYLSILAKKIKEKIKPELDDSSDWVKPLSKKYNMTLT